MVFQKFNMLLLPEVYFFLPGKNKASIFSINLLKYLAL